MPTRAAVEDGTTNIGTFPKNQDQMYSFAGLSEPRPAKLQAYYSMVTIH